MVSVASGLATALNPEMEDWERLNTLTAQYDAQSKAASFVRWVAALASAHPGPSRQTEAATIYRSRWPSYHLDVIEKAAVAPGTTSDVAWAGPLAPLTPLASAFMGSATRSSALASWRSSS